MKLSKTIALLCFMSAFSISFGQAQMKNLTITVQNIGEVKGDLLIYLYDKKENFPKDGKYYKVYKFAVTGKEQTVVLKDLPVQEYALNIVHDADGNGKCNQTKIGFPTERIGFSNNIKPKMRVPSFDSAKIGKEVTKISVELYEF